MPIPIEEYELLHEFYFPLGLYARRRFDSQEKFLLFIFKETGLKFTKKTYKELFKEIYDKIGKNKLLSVIGVKTEYEAELRAYLYYALYHGLKEERWNRQLSPLYKEVFKKDINIKRKIDKKFPSRELAFFSRESHFTNAWVKLCYEGIMPSVFQYGNITLGAAGWLKCKYKKMSRFSSKDESFFTLIKDKFDDESIAKIYDFLIDEIHNRFQKENEDFKNKVNIIISKYKRSKNQNLKLLIGMQLISTFSHVNHIVEIINELIHNNIIKPPKINYSYEQFNDQHSNWILTPYGIFIINDEWEINPNQELSQLILNTFEKKYFEPELKNYKGNYEQKVLAYCIKEKPEKILINFGKVKLRKIAEELGILSTLKINEEDELIKLIMLKLGFHLPPILIGITESNKILNNALLRLEKKENISLVMMDVYGVIDKILKELLFFYICILWDINTININYEEIEEKLSKISKSLNVSSKPFNILTLGEKIKFLRKINKEVSINKKLNNKFNNIFKRKELISKENLLILNFISPFRSELYAHKKSSTSSKHIKNSLCIKIINETISFIKNLDKGKIYPILIRIKAFMINEYGVNYIEAIDEKENNWIIAQLGLDNRYLWIMDRRKSMTHKPYFIYSNTEPVAINPIIIEKIF